MRMTSTDPALAVTDETTSAESGSPHQSRCCVHCGEVFQPRKHGGGKPQKFCDEKCRLAHYAEAQRSERMLTTATQDHDAKCKKEAGRDQPATGTPHGGDGFDWRSDAVIHEQQAIALYWNQSGGLVIRQEGTLYEHNDSYVVVNKENVQPFLDELCDFLGIPSAGL